MPTDFVNVTQVHRVPTAKAGTTRFDIITAPKPGTTYGPLYETVDPWIASMCERAKDTGQPVALTWMDSRYGRRIVQVRLLTDGDVAFERSLAGDRR